MSTPQPPSPHALADALLQVVTGAQPLAATLYGLPGHDHELADPSPAGDAAAADALEAVATRCRQLVGDLDDAALTTLGFVEHTAQVLAATRRIPAAEFSVPTGFYSPVTDLMQLLPRMPLTTPDRAEGYLDRLNAVPGFLRTVGERHRDGLAAGRVPAARLVASAVAYLDAVLADPDLSGLRLPAGDGGAGLTGFDQRRDQLVDGGLRPALADYRRLLAEEVLAAGRDDDHPGLAHLPGGEAYYAAWSREHTGTGRSADDLHAVGLALCAQIREQMAEIGPQAVGTGIAAEVISRLREDPALRFRDAEQMMAQAVAAVRRAEAAAPSWFGVVPDHACRVEEVPAAEAPSAPPAYYLPPSLDGARLGTYFLNTSQASARIRAGAESMAFHEAVPGHHFQLAIAQQATALPMARRLFGDTASLEGWGLYAESLADEMGLYSDQLARLGMLANDAWRAARLVVDTGLHAHGWTRAEAVAWMRENTAVAVVEIETEVDRYIGAPGQALAYMVGRLELLALRARAGEALGELFDLRAFHDLVLAAGPLPLGVLAGAVDRWISRTATAGR